ncbi:hypothetical protein [Bowmanella denitrificans]|uniref:hypothetical protein n=1 Tax=Bowmanella denitrificans TaxID=366582 RepID=UPI0011AEDB02|nr:hypothetical protein [Bowmanella denitrificans]
MPSVRVNWNQSTSVLNPNPLNKKCLRGNAVDVRYADGRELVLGLRVFIEESAALMMGLAIVDITNVVMWYPDSDIGFGDYVPIRGCVMGAVSLYGGVHLVLRDGSPVETGPKPIQQLGSMCPVVPLHRSSGQ